MMDNGPDSSLNATPTNNHSLVGYGAKVALLAAIYYLTGKLGLSLAVPPGYATIIWPPSGIALGALLAHGPRMAPGVFLGSFLLNCELALAGGGAALEWDRVLLAASIATGSTLQAFCGQFLLRRWFGVPLHLRRISEVFRLFAVAGPLCCAIAATVGVSSLVISGDMAGRDIAHNWLSWWAGDVFGIVVFLPLVLVLPGGAAMFTWRDRAIRDLQALGLLLLVLPLGLTFYAWKYFADGSQRQSQVHFETLARESEQAIVTRLGAYASATRSGAGILQGSEFVSREEWRTFSDTIRLRDDFPGMLGLGWIEHVPAQGRDSFLARVRADGMPNFRIHPLDSGASLDVITYIEPEISNAAVLGLNLGANQGSREATARAAETGLPTLTRALSLVRDEESAPGFLLLQAVYRNDVPLDGAERRRQALRGYVYAPFLARAFIEGTTPSQGRSFEISIIEGDEIIARSGSASTLEPRFEMRRNIVVHGMPWTLRWQSTSEFEQSEYSNSGVFVLFSGLLFTGLFAVLLIVLGARRMPAPAARTRRPVALPIATSALLAGGSLAAYLLMSNAETVHVTSLVEEETRSIESALERSTRQQLQALRRMAHRWASGNGMAYPVWRNDARDYVRQLDGLEELQWIGPDYHVQWAEGVRSNWLENHDVRTSEKLARELADSAERGAPLVTEPREIAPGDSGFTVYIPLMREGRFDGFLAAQFSSRGFFRESMAASTGSAFAFSVRFGSVTYFDNGEIPAADAVWTRESGFNLNDKRWTFQVSPTQRFIDAKQSLMPMIVLLCGLLIAGLSGILVRYVLVARAKAARLQDAARALAESEQRYALALRGMSVGLWDWDIKTNALYWSERFREILGVEAAHTGTHYGDFASRLHPDDQAMVSTALKAHLSGRGPYDVEFRMQRADGEYVWVHVFGQAQFDADGVAVRMAGSLQDITRERQQQQALKNSETRLRLLIANTPVAVAMFDSEMRYIVTSRRWLQDYGLEGRDIAGQSHYDVFPEVRVMPRFVEIHQRALRGEKFELQEDCWTRVNGAREWTQWAILPWLEGEEVRGFVLFTENITARKQAEAAQRTNDAMIRAAMDKAPIGKALVKPDGGFIKVNPALCRLLGYSAEELLATDFQALTHPEDLVADLANLRALLDGRIASYQMEKRYLHRDGRVIWAELSVSLVRRDDGEVDFLVSQIQDITDRKAVERIKNEFVSVVTQEVCAPLTVIRDSLDMISRMHEIDMPYTMKRMLAASTTSCERLTTLVNDIHDLDRLAAGRMQLEFRDASIAYLVREAVEACEFLARKHDVSFQLAAIDPSTVVYVDPARAVQALANLLSNAAKFSPPGSTIDVGAKSDGDAIRVTVRDRGEGIPEEFRARIFGRFAQAETGAGRGGTGLGLHIARELVVQMRGEIGFVSQLGAGSTFWIEFPVVSRAVPAAALC